MLYHAEGHLCGIGLASQDGQDADVRQIHFFCTYTFSVDVFFYTLCVWGQARYCTANKEHFLASGLKSSPKTRPCV